LFFQRYLWNNRRAYFSILLILVVITKRAQWPFIRWLPAAIAAPTPVRALVHRSTLVTAGVWLLVRFSVSIGLNFRTWLVLGFITLSVARLAAIQEVDAKKIVALSTLRQLGLMFISIAVGNSIICLFHIIIHALAKANLFIVVGRLLHSGFSQQDSRLLFTSSLNTRLTIRALIRIFSLTGVVFTSGFFSKEQILFNQSTLINGRISWVFMILIRRLTVAYCLKIVYFLISKGTNRLFSMVRRRVLIISPIFTLSRLSLIIGWRYMYNIRHVSLIRDSLESAYWGLWVIGPVFLIFTSQNYPTSIGFFLRSKFIDAVLTEKTLSFKKTR